MNVVFCSSEAVPFAKTGGLADVCGALPIALKKQGIDVSVVLPRYRCIDSRFGLKKLSKDISTATIGDDIPVYCIEHDGFFNRPGLYGDDTGDYTDNLERFTYFCQRTVALLKELHIAADIVHCHDWQTALIPAYLKTTHAKDPFYNRLKTILTIHNLAYQGIFAQEGFSKTGLNKRLFNSERFEFYDKVNLLKGGIALSDTITTVSTVYAREIQTKELGCGLEGVLQKKDITGILNGIDTEYWNPRTDSLITEQYDARTVNAKKDNKKSVQQTVGLPVRNDVPLFGFVGRLAHQKGLDVLAKTFDRIAQSDAQMVLLGVGEAKYRALLQAAAHRFPEKVAVVMEFNEPMAHRIYAGSDIFVIPSVYEPCGLSQMISFRYGTIPLAFATGGLKETVIPFDAADGSGNGFVFNQYGEDALCAAVDAAIATFCNKSVFNALRKKIMRLDFSWDRAAQHYKTLYEQCMKA